MEKIYMWVYSKAAMGGGTQHDSLGTVLRVTGALAFYGAVALAALVVTTIVTLFYSRGWAVVMLPLAVLSPVMNYSAQWFHKRAMQDVGRVMRSIENTALWRTRGHKEVREWLDSDHAWHDVYAALVEVHLVLDSIAFGDRTIYMIDYSVFDEAPNPFDMFGDKWPSLLPRTYRELVDSMPAAAR